MRKLVSFLIGMSLAVTLFAQRAGDIVVLYDNDVHCAVHGYPVMAGLRDSLEHMGCKVYVVSAGDFSFGGPFGSVSKGEFIVRMMNAVGYDAVCLGNHEFDYGIGQLRRLESMLTAPMLCCNLMPNNAVTKPLDKVRSIGNVAKEEWREDTRYATPFAPFVIRRFDGVSVAFVGITTPNTMYTSAPKSFQDSVGNYIYHFSLATLPQVLQHSVDAAKAAGADVVVVLSHLGDSEGEPNSVQIAAPVTGVDVILDGHDHHIIPCRKIRDKEGKQILLTSTGKHFKYLGMLTIPVNDGAQVGSIPPTRLLPIDSLRHAGCVNAAVADTLLRVKELYDLYGNRVVAHSDVDLVAEENDIPVCRLRETNLGDLIADACRIRMGTDIGWLNGGSMRDNIAAGPVTYNRLLSACPYSNNMVIIRTTGQDILDALEIAMRGYPKADGCFPQVSGLSFSFDTTVATSVVLDSKGVFQRVEGWRRVSDVRIGERPLDPEATYTIAGPEYILINGGDAYAFPHKEVLSSGTTTDLQALEDYMTENLHGRIGAPYDTAQGRIVVKN